MVDYIKLMPVDIQEMIFSSYFQRHVLKEMVERYFPHLSNLKSDKEFQLFKQRCAEKKNEVREIDPSFTTNIVKHMLVLTNDNIIAERTSDKYSTFMAIINFISENDVNLGIVYESDLFMGMLYKKLNEDIAFQAKINPSYYILFFNEIPKTPFFRGCY